MVVVLVRLDAMLCWLRGGTERNQFGVSIKYKKKFFFVFFLCFFWVFFCFFCVFCVFLCFLWGVCVVRVRVSGVV